MGSAPSAPSAPSVTGVRPAGTAAAFPATAALAGLAERAGIALDELLDLSAAELDSLTQKENIKEQTLEQRAAEVGISQARLAAAGTDPGGKRKKLLELIVARATEEQKEKLQP